MTKEFREMGFYAMHIDKVLTAITKENQIILSSNKDKKVDYSRVTSITRHEVSQYMFKIPLTDEETSQAKVHELTNAGYTAIDARFALSKFDENLEKAFLWLSYNKPMHMHYYIYHPQTDKVLALRPVGGHTVTVKEVNTIHFIFCVCVCCFHLCVLQAGCMHAYFFWAEMAITTGIPQFFKFKFVFIVIGRVTIATKGKSSLGF